MEENLRSFFGIGDWNVCNFTYLGDLWLKNRNHKFDKPTFFFEEKRVEMFIHTWLKIKS